MTSADSLGHIIEEFRAWSEGMAQEHYPSYSEVIQSMYELKAEIEQLEAKDERSI